MRRAILSVSDKTGLIPFGQALVGARVRAGLDRRHRQGAGRRRPAGRQRQRRHRLSRNDGRPRQDAASEDPRRHPRAPHRIPRISQLAEQHGIGLVDLVVVNLYPFVETAAKPGIAFDDLIEQIDIGGPSLVRAASKNFRDVLIVVSPKDYDAVIAELDQPTAARRRHSASSSRAAPSNTPAPTTPRSHRRLGEVTVEGESFRDRDPQALKPVKPAGPRDSTQRSCATCATAKTRINPPRGMRSHPPAGLGAPAILQGKELSFTNLLDLDAAARIVLEFDEPAAAVIKHTNPCGVATGAIDRRGLRARARSGFARGVRRHHRAQSHARRRDRSRDRLDVHRSRGRARRSMTRRAPILATKANLRVVVADFRTLADTREYRSILGAMLVQERDRVIEAQLPWPTDDHQGRDQAPADGGRVAGDAIRLARDGAREVEHRDLHRRRAHARDRRRPDEPRRCGEGRRQQGRRMEGRRRADR